MTGEAWVGVGTLSYSQTSGWVQIGVVPDGIQRAAIGYWAFENEAKALVADPPNFEIIVASAEQCTRSDAPFQFSSLEGGCIVKTLDVDFVLEVASIDECTLRYSASSRLLEFMDTSSSEGCAYAVVSGGAGSSPIVGACTSEGGAYQLSGCRGHACVCTCVCVCVLCSVPFCCVQWHLMYLSSA